MLLFWGAGSPRNTMWPVPRPTSIPSGILIHPAVWLQQTWAKNVGCAQKGGRAAVLPFWGGGAGSPSNTMSLDRGLPPYQVAPWSILPFGHSRHGPKIGGLFAFFGEGKLGPHLTQCRLGSGLPLYQVAP